MLVHKLDKWKLMMLSFAQKCIKHLLRQFYLYAQRKVFPNSMLQNAGVCAMCKQVFLISCTFLFGRPFQWKAQVFNRHSNGNIQSVFIKFCARNCGIFWAFPITLINIKLELCFQNFCPKLNALNAHGIYLKCTKNTFQTECELKLTCDKFNKRTSFKSTRLRLASNENAFCVGKCGRNCNKIVENCRMDLCILNVVRAYAFLCGITLRQFKKLWFPIPRELLQPATVFSNCSHQVFRNRISFLARVAIASMKISIEFVINKRITKRFQHFLDSFRSKFYFKLNTICVLADVIRSNGTVIRVHWS